jgi:hypothetical protein
MKRFTATEKWSKEWFQKLSPHLKCFWLYICDTADAAGVWDANFGLASYVIGQKVKPSDLASFGQRILVAQSGKVKIVSFIEFQYGRLSESCPAHKPVFRVIAKHEDSLFNTLSDSLSNRLQEEDKETEGEEDKETEGGLPFQAAEFQAAWDSWILYRRESKKKLTRTGARRQLARLAEWGEQRAIAAINLSIAQGWQGIYEGNHQSGSNGAKPTVNYDSDEF